MSQRSKVFVSYCHEDIRWLRAVREQLAVLEREGLLDVFEDTQLRAGEPWLERLHSEMSVARVGLLLLSAPFLSSSFVRNEEIPRLFTRHAEGGMLLYPLLVRPCAWQEVAWLANLQLRPQDAKRRAKAVSAFAGAARDQVLADVATEIAKLVKDVEVRPSDPTGQTARQPLATAVTKGAPGDHLRAESITFRFSEAVELDARPINDVLGAYVEELNTGGLGSFQFVEEHIDIEQDVTYRLLADRFCARNGAKGRKALRQLEDALRRGLTLLLNIAYLKEKQVHNAYQACFWFARAIRCQILALLATAIEPKSADEQLYVKEANSSPLFGSHDSVEAFYGFKLIRLDLWHPDKRDAAMFSLYFRAEGYAGAWFTDHPQQPGPFAEHWSPNDFYNFVLPQVVMRHIVLGEPMPEAWDGYFIGAA